MKPVTIEWIKPGVVGWDAATSDGSRFLGFAHPGAVCASAQRYCDEQNAKAAEPKPPEGFAFSDEPGLAGPDGEVLVWVPGYGFEAMNPRRMDMRTTPRPRWLVPAASKAPESEALLKRRIENQLHVIEQLREELAAAPKKETREEAEERFEAQSRSWGPYFKGAFMAGAGFA